MNIYEKLLASRAEVLADGVTKQGNTERYSYFRLDEIVPLATKAFTKHKLIFVANEFDNEKNIARGTLINIENPEEKLEFSINYPKYEFKGQNPFQIVGSGCTYCRRYLYMCVLDLIECDALEEMIGSLLTIYTHIRELQSNCKDRCNSLYNSGVTNDAIKAVFSKSKTITTRTKEIANKWENKTATEDELVSLEADLEKFSEEIAKCEATVISVSTINGGNKVDINSI